MAIHPAAAGQLQGAQNYHIAPAEVRSAQVLGELSRLQDALANLEGSAEQLMQRLGGVMRAQPPSANQANAAVSEILVPIADQIRATSMRTRAVNGVIDSILQRLEI